MTRHIPSGRGFERLGIKQPKAPRAHKYGSRRVLFRGRLFDSQKEANRYAHHLLRQRAGEVALIMCQVPFQISDTILGPDGKVAARGERWVADFVIQLTAGGYEVEDCKGFRTASFIRKKRRVEAIYGFKIQEV